MNVRYCRTCGQPIWVADGGAAPELCPRCNSRQSATASELAANPYASPAAVQSSKAAAPRPAANNALAYLALALPVIGAVVECFQPDTRVMAMSFGIVVLSSILVFIDAIKLGPVDPDGVERASAGSLLAGGILFWIVFYPVAFFRRRHFASPNLGPASLLVALIFLGLPIVYELLKPVDLPDCDAPEVKQLIEQIVSESPNLVRDGRPIIDHHHEISFDSQRQIRTGRCTMHLGGEDVPLDYTVSWQDRAKGIFQVKIGAQ